jgi:hypothetical protein
MGFNESLGKATVEVRASTKKLKSDLNTAVVSTRSAATRMRSAFSGFAGMLAGAFAVTAVTQFGVSLVKAAANAEEMRAKFEVVFGSTARSVEQWAGTLANSIGRSKLQLMEYASSLQDTFVPMGFAREKAAALAKQMVELSEDVASFSNKLTPDVMRDFQSALVGNHETVRKYGIVITQARLDQELFNMGIEEGVKGATEQEKTMARLNLILGDTKDAHGDATRTSESFTNQMKKLNGEIFDMKAQLGERLLPLLTEMIPAVRTFVNVFAEGIALWIEGFLKLQQVMESVWNFMNRDISATPFGRAMQGAQSGTPGQGGFFGALDNFESGVPQVAAPGQPVTEKQLQAFSKELSAIKDVNLARDRLKEIVSDNNELRQEEIDQLVRVALEARKVTEEVIQQGNEVQANTEKFKKMGDEAEQAMDKAEKKSKTTTTNIQSQWQGMFQSIFSQLGGSIGGPFGGIISSLGGILFSGLGGGGESGGGLGSLFGGGEGGGGLGSLFGGLFAEGGRPPLGKVSVVGEKGPELFVPDGAGTIIPNGAGGGGMTVNINQNFALGVQDTVRAEVMNMRDVFKRDAVDAVSEAVSRGGTVARTIRGQ